MAYNGPLPQVVPAGGTGIATSNAYSILCAGTTNAGAFQNVSGVGSSGQVLTSNGASSLPTWQNTGDPARSCAFMYYLSGNHNSVTGDGTTYTIGTDALSQSFDLGSNMTTGGTFTAPNTGYYFIMVSASLYNFQAGNVGQDIILLAVGPTTATTIQNTALVPTGSTGGIEPNITVSAAAIIPLSATNTMTFTVSLANSTKSVGIAGESTGILTYVCGYQLA